MVTSEVLELLTPAEYRAARQRIFPSGGSLEWYVRQHRPALIAAGALLMIAGRWQICVSKFDAYVLQAGAQAAQRQRVAA